MIRALFRALDVCVAEGKKPPANRYPRLSDGTLTTLGASGRNRNEYLARITATATALVFDRFLLVDDVGEAVRRAAAHYE